MTDQTPPTPSALQKLAWPALLGIPTAGLAFLTLKLAYGPRNYYDFGIFWRAGRAAIHGQTPYPAITEAALRHQDQFVYPAPAAIALIPFGLLPMSVAATIFIVLNVAATITALRLVGVRDWRCHALVFCSIATIQAVIMGTFTPLLLLGAAVAWRWREHRTASAAAVACVAMVKLFLAPLAVWQAAMRRWATVALAAALTAGATVACWALLEFHGFTTYPQLLSLLSRMEQQKGFSLIALAAGLGAGIAAGKVLSYAVAAILCGLAWRWARRPGGETRAFALTLTAGLALSPIVWLNYFMLLALPLGLRRPRLHPAWILMLAPWIFANANTVAPSWKVLAFWAATAAVLVLSLRGPQTPAEPAESRLPSDAEVEVRVVEVSRSATA